jgi:hypothetical protein
MRIYDIACVKQIMFKNASIYFSKININNSSLVSVPTDLLLCNISSLALMNIYNVGSVV